MNYKSIIESLLFVSGDEGLSKDELKEILTLDNIDPIIEEIKLEYQNENRGIEIKILGDRLKLTTKIENNEYIKKMVNFKESDTLSEAALET